MNKTCDFYVAYIRFWDDRCIKRLIWGTKMDLYAYIGYMYSNSDEKIVRIDYMKTYRTEHIKPFDRYYFISDDGGLCMKLL